MLWPVQAGEIDEGEMKRRETGRVKTLCFLEKLNFARERSNQKSKLNRLGNSKRLELLNSLQIIYN